MIGPASAMRILARRAAAACAAAVLLLPAATQLGCEGGTTGVDNPGLAELPVEFRDEAGGVVLVRGALEIYDRDHNPALDSAPLLRLEVADGPGLRLTSADFDRILAARPPKRSAATKRAGAAASDSLIRFNLLFRGVSGSGAAAAGPAYDPIRKRFIPEEGRRADVRLLPKPLLRFAASVHRAAAQGEVGRIFLPGTPFQATLVDSDFILEGLPEGRFPLRLLGGDGYLYAVRESLDTRAGRAFTAAPDPVGRIAMDPPAGFGVDAGPPLSLFAGQDAPLPGRLLGADSNDSRVSIIWRFLERPAGDSARLSGPTRLGATLVAPAPPAYTLELAATLGAVTVRDTLFLKVIPPPVPAAAQFNYPKPGDTLVQGQYYKASWDYPVTGLVRLEVSYKEGTEGSWSLVADSLVSGPGQGGYGWTPPVLGTSFYNCYLRLKAIPSDSVVGISPAFVLAFR